MGQKGSIIPDALHILIKACVLHLFIYLSIYLRMEDKEIKWPTASIYQCSI